MVEQPGRGLSHRLRPWCSRHPGLSPAALSPMTSRERILAAIEHRAPDYVPVDLGATPSSGISAIAYGRLKQHLGITGGHTRVYDVVQQLAQPEEALLDRFGVDAIDLAFPCGPFAHDLPRTHPRRHRASRARLCAG